MVTNVYEVTSAGKPDAPAIGAPGRPWLSYAGLKKLTDDTLAALNGVGIGRGDRVAMVIPNGPEMASSFIAVASGTTSARPGRSMGAGTTRATSRPASARTPCASA